MQGVGTKVDTVERLGPQNVHVPEVEQAVLRKLAELLQQPTEDGQLVFFAVGPERMVAFDAVLDRYKSNQLVEVLVR